MRLMISMDLKQQILHYYRVDELSLREITRRTETDRKTVTRLINAYEQAIKEIDKWLKENDRRRNNGMRKQCLKCTDIHRELVNKGMNVSYSSVCKYVHRKKAEKSPKPKDVYLRIHREPGEECEFDWGEVKLFIGKEKVSLMMAVFCLSYSTVPHLLTQIREAKTNKTVQLLENRFRKYDLGKSTLPFTQNKSIFCRL